MVEAQLDTSNSVALEKGHRGGPRVESLRPTTAAITVRSLLGDAVDELHDRGATLRSRHRLGAAAAAELGAAGAALVLAVADVATGLMAARFASTHPSHMAAIEMMLASRARHEHAPQSRP